MKLNFVNCVGHVCAIYIKVKGYSGFFSKIKPAGHCASAVRSHDFTNWLCLYRDHTSSWSLVHVGLPAAGCTESACQNEHFSPSKYLTQQENSPAPPPGCRKRLIMRCGLDTTSCRDLILFS